jgi:hypothetical protein
MASPSVMKGDFHFPDRVTFTDIGLPDSSVDASMIEASAGIEASKCEQERVIRYTQVTGTAVVANAGEGLHIVTGATGDVISIEAVVTGAIATGADRTVTIDLKKSTGGAAYASILTSTIVLDNTNTLRVLEAGAITGGTLVDGDSLLLTVAVAGASGNQAQGLLVVVRLREDATA